MYCFFSSSLKNFFLDFLGFLVLKEFRSLALKIKSGNIKNPFFCRLKGIKKKEFLEIFEYFSLKHGPDLKFTFFEFGIV